jgi:hypothetical protein
VGDSRPTRWGGSGNRKGKVKGLALSASADACNTKCSSFRWLVEVVLEKAV